MTTYLLLCIDGCSPAYLRHADTPTLDALASAGLYKEVKAMVPTVTNVNNVSILTRAYPSQHGITGNYFRDRRTGQSQYMETADFLLCETVFQKLQRAGWHSALLTVKDKLRALLEAGAAISISAEKPPAWLVERLGPPPSVYSIEVNHWLMTGLRELLAQEDAPEFVYLATTDYTMHKFAPEDDRSRWHIWRLDELLGEALDVVRDDVVIAVTADHGMRAKARAVDLTRVLGKANVQAEAVPIIKDRYVAHHRNLGGAAYVFLRDRRQQAEAMGKLVDIAGVEEVLTAEQAVERFNLHAERIGDLMVLAEADTVFGNPDGEETTVDIRSHGSLHTRTVPLVAYGSSAPVDAITHNKDAIACLGMAEQLMDGRIGE